MPPDELDADVRAVGDISAVPAILEAACKVTGMGFAAIARVTDKHWIACAVQDEVNFGLQPGGELPLETTLCHEVRGGNCAIVIDHVAEDPDYAQHHTPRLYGLQSYISVPIVLSDGSFFGTLCAIDAKPASLKTGAAVPVFKLFAQLIARHLDDRLALTQSEAALATSLETADLREQFIAILGHDLRNPIAAVQAGISLLQAEPDTDKARRILAAMAQAGRRMTGLVNDMLDLARGRLAGGLIITRDGSGSLADTLRQVIDEIRTAHPECRIETRIAIDRPVPVDLARVGQLLSNLLANAVTHGNDGGQIEVGAATRNGAFELWVANTGAPIPPERMKRLFQPYYRGDSRSSASALGSGLGLGLYIAHQIALAHGGSLDAVSDERETRFTFRLQLAGQALP